MDKMFHIKVTNQSGVRVFEINAKIQYLESVIDLLKQYANGEEIFLKFYND